MTYTIAVENLTKSFGDLAVLTGLDLRIRAGTVYALLGPNGAGKTTAVRILSTLLRPDSGSVRIAGHDAATQPRAVRGAITLTGQHAAVDEVLTGRENLLMMARLRHLSRAECRRRTAGLLTRFDLTDAADRRVATYSGGMRRRLDIAVGLVTDPPVILLDEPTTGLDPRSRRDVWETVAGLRTSGATVLLTTQYLEEADLLADRVGVLHGGRIVAEGTAEELKARVGGDTLELVLGNEAAVRDALGALRSHGAGARAEPETLGVHVPTDGSAAAVRDVLDLLSAHGVEVERIRLHRPSLDDVFLALTASPAPRPTEEVAA